MKALYQHPSYDPPVRPPTLAERVERHADQLEDLAASIRSVRLMVVDARPALARRLAECEISARILVVELRRDARRDGS